MYAHKRMYLCVSALPLGVEDPIPQKLAPRLAPSQWSGTPGSHTLACLTTNIVNDQPTNPCLDLAPLCESVSLEIALATNLWGHLTDDPASAHENVQRYDAEILLTAKGWLKGDDTVRGLQEVRLVPSCREEPHEG